MQEPKCGKCGGVMTPADSKIHPELFLHDKCLPADLLVGVMNKPRELEMQVLACYSCGEMHDGITLHKFTKDNPPWTHWYACPKSGDPVPMNIEVKGDAPVERARRVIADLDRALESGRWLSLIFFVTGKAGKVDRVHLQWNSEQFPHAEYEACQKLFSQECAKQGGLPAPLEPLPRAPGFQPASQEFDLSSMIPGLRPQVIPANSLQDRIGEALKPANEQAESGR